MLDDLTSNESATDRATGSLKLPTRGLEAASISPQERGASAIAVQIAPLGIFLVAVVGAVALGLGITDYFSDHPYVWGYLLAYAGYKVAKLLVRDEPDPNAPAVSRRTIFDHLALLLFFAAAPFERTYVYASEAPPFFGGFGLLIGLLGLWISLAASIQLSFSSRRETPGFITTGLYRYIRHPGYAGTFLMLLGWPVEFGAPLSFIISLIAGMAMLRRRIRSEEAVLRETFGEEYAAYIRRTDRLFPSVW